MRIKTGSPIACYWHVFYTNDIQEYYKHLATWSHEVKTVFYGKVDMEKLKEVTI